MRMFADDCIIYREITAENDVLQIQSDLDKIQAWCEKWEMKLNLDKTVCMKFTRKKITSRLSYTINNTALSPVTEYKYLGVYFTPSLCWHRQVDYTVAKASRALGFLRRNTRDFPQAVKALLYKSNVRSVLEYACTVWDPSTVTDKQKLERVQNLAVRYVLGTHARNKDYSATFSKQTLQWEILEHRRSKLCLKLFHEIYFSETGVPREEYIASPHYISARIDHAYKVREYKSNTASFASSFFQKLSGSGIGYRQQSCRALVANLFTMLWPKLCYQPKRTDECGSAFVCVCSGSIFFFCCNVQCAFFIVNP